MSKSNAAKAPLRALTLPLYSTRLMPATVPVTLYKFFSVGLKAVGQGFAVPLTESETNLTASGSLPSDYQFYRVDAIGIDISYTAFLAGVPSQNIITPMRIALENGYWEFQSGNTKIPLGPTKFFPSGIGLTHRSYYTQAAAGAADYTTYYNNNGIPSKESVAVLQEPLIIKGGQSFSMNYYQTLVNTNTGTFRMKCILYGEYTQSVLN